MVDENQRLFEAGMDDLAARGRLGSGEEFNMRLAARQQSGNTARDLARDLTQQEINTRMGAVGAASDLAGNIRGQNFAQEQQIADTINNYAKWLSEMKTQGAKDNAAAKNLANARNVETRQNISNTNQMNKYSTALDNLNRRNSLESQQSNFALNKAQAVGGALNNLAQGKYAAQAAKADAIRGIGAGVGGLADTAASIYTGGAYGALDSATEGTSKKKYPSSFGYF